MAKQGLIFLVIAVVSVSLVFFVGCETSGQSGALIGTAVGAGAGQAIGGDTESTLIGAGVGAAGGYIVGNEMDKKKMREEMNTATVNVTNSNGSITPVKLTKQGIGYVGPKGEFYDHLPTPEELKPVYGF